MLSREEFAELVRLGPLVSIDLVVRDAQGRALLGLRKNEPAKGYWFAPGGRINKNERLDDAFRRITRAELGVELKRADARFMGVYEHFYETNFSQAGGFGTHYVALAHEVRLDNKMSGQARTYSLENLPADQHHEYRWMSDAEILADPKVHGHTREYFVGKFENRNSKNETDRAR